jgi:hypothetical protein
MYEVVLVDKNSKDRIGDLGKYESKEEANSEAENYNRKSDRHRAIAVVKPVLKANPIRRGLRLGGSLQRRKVVNPQPVVEEPNNFDFDLEIESESESDVEIESESESESVEIPPPIQKIVIRPSQPFLQQRPPPPPQFQREEQPRIETKPEVSDHVLIYDDINNKHMVLKDGAFTRQTIMIGNGRYNVINRGDFYTMITERNNRNRS